MVSTLIMVVEKIKHLEVIQRHSHPLLLKDLGVEE